MSNHTVPFRTQPLSIGVKCRQVRHRPLSPAVVSISFGDGPVSIKSSIIEILIAFVRRFISPCVIIITIGGARCLQKY
ncbi:protein of unknown function [Rhodovastum atsumiense]|nr:protein of unknown function [Rhodovastum atsumiense]